MSGKPHLNVTRREDTPVFNLVVRVSRKDNRFQAIIANLAEVTGEGSSLRDAIANVTNKAKAFIREEHSKDGNFQTLQKYPAQEADQQQFLIPVHL